jgi:hypothetical protein
VRTILIHPQFTVIDGKTRGPVTWDGDVDDLPARLAASGARGHIMIIFAGDWSYGSYWTQQTYDSGLKLTLTTTTALAESRCPLDRLWAEDTVSALTRWYEQAGAHWYMTPGVAGLEVLRQLLLHPNALTTDQPDIEAWEDVAQFGRHDAGGLTQFDAARAGLAAAGVAELAPGKLVWSDQRRDMWGRAGWVKVELGPWNLPLPAPWGPREVDDRPVWLTCATVRLLDQLQRDGVFAYRVHESYTTPAKRMLRDWSEKIDGIYRTHSILDDPLEHAMAAAAKAVGRETLGMFDSKGGASTRSDWWHTITATKRCNGFRKIYKLWQATGIVPTAVDDDAVFYEINHAGPPQPAFNMIFPPGDQLGHFHWTLPT